VSPDTEPAANAKKGFYHLHIKMILYEKIRKRVVQICGETKRKKGEGNKDYTMIGHENSFPCSGHAT
jgi:hypothetical protein